MDRFLVSFLQAYIHRAGNYTCLLLTKQRNDGCQCMAVHVGKERTSLVSTPSLAELYKFAKNFLLVKKRKRKKNKDGRKRVK